MVQFKMFFVKLKRKQKIQFNKIEHTNNTHEQQHTRTTHTNNTHEQ